MMCRFVSFPTTASVVALCASLASAQFAGFGPRTDIAAPTSGTSWSGSPGALAAGDLNGDGHIDVVVRGGNRIGVFMNDGQGGLLAPVLYDKGLSSSDRGIRVVDLNGDTFPDIVISRSFNDSWVSVWLNNGDGTFAARADYAAPSGFGSCRMLDVGDITGDGFPDVVVGDENTGRVLIYENDGAGIFSLIEAISPSQATQIWSIAAGDIDGNGTTDLVLACMINNTLATQRLFRYRNDGLGNLTPDANLLVLPANLTTREMTLADLDLNGTSDLVFGPSTLYVMLNNGGGGFSPFASYQTNSPNITQISIADLNGDGYPDVAVGNESATASTSVLINNSTGGFEPPIFFGNAGSGSPSSPGVVLADLDGNSTPDLISISSIFPASTFLNTRLNLTDPFAPGAFDLVSVPNNSSGLPLPEVLQSWPGGGGAAPLSWTRADGFVNTYTLTIALDPGFNMVVLEQTAITATSFNLPIGLLQNNTRYYWQVEAQNIAGTTLSSNGPWSFSTRCLGDIADDFGTPGNDGMISFGDFLALLGLIGPCP